MKYNALRYATESLLDEERNRAYLKAIKKIIKPGDVVLDCGAGTGIFSILAAKEGAREVFAIECDEFVCQLAKENVKSAGVDNTVKVINCDAADYSGPPVDVLITQLLDTMLITEEQVKTINSLHAKQIINKNTVIIPYRSTSFFQPIFYDFEFYDCQVPMIVQSRNTTTDRIIEHISSDFQYLDIDFRDIVDTKCSYKGRHLAHNKGWLNAIKFTTVTHILENVLLGTTADLCQPCIIPVHEMYVRSGELFDVEIEYDLGGGYENLRVKIS